MFVLPNEAAGPTASCAVGGAGQGVSRHGDAVSSARPIPAEEITVASGETRDRLVITMTQPGAIAGRLFDENGDPVEGVVPRALTGSLRRRTPPSRQYGALRAADGRPGAVSPLRTRGRREHFVSAAVGQIDVQTAFVDLPGYSTTYFPGTPNPAEAQRVVVGRSQDVPGIDFPIAQRQDRAECLDARSIRMASRLRAVSP